MAFKPTRDRVKPEEIDTTPKRRPPWIRVGAPTGETYKQVHRLMRSKSLHTVCEEAMCPNVGECWGAGTATFLMLGDICTRSCGFCDVKRGKPEPIDWDEPDRVARAVRDMDLRHAVITSVNRDEREDGGAPIFAAVIRRIRELQPGCSVEVLIPDFKGDRDALKKVIAVEPDVVNHNIEVPENLYPKINRPPANYRRSMSVLKHAKELGAASKSGIMVGLGEKREDILRAFSDLRAVSCDLLTIGQYLQPTKHNAPVEAYYTPESFQELKEIAMGYGFRAVESGPLVRSSYRAHRLYRSLNRGSH